ncbi:OmpP1/FadL family transporter [Taibaiella helva]|uniref:OmpP1/FadL family transporter n=1 Tax=Taibaiella helva TaxID=2301235 RepID=UPI000E56B704|nr:outer membrane protein transport protein [Taibaiella helva]
MKKICTLTATVLLASSMAFGGSFQLNLQGIRQTAMGGTGVAWPWDASTIFFNPGGLSRLSGIQAYGSVNIVTPNVKYVQTPTGGYSASSNTHTTTPFAVYVGGPIRKGSKIGVGLGIYTPFGNKLDWGNTWTGRYVVESISLQSFFFQPTVSYAINDMISVGAGFVYARGTVDIEKAIPVQDINGNDGQAKLKGNANGFGFNVGVQIKATEDLQFGVSYRSKVKMDVNGGDATFTVPASLAGNFPNTTFDSKLPLPEILTVGLGYKFTSDLMVQADVVLAGWKTYDSLSFDFAENKSVQDTHDPRSYKNTVAFRLGAHYQIDNQFAIMAGGAYDPTPTRDNLLSPDAVDGNRLTLSCGATYQPLPRLSIMAALNYTTTPKRNTSYDPAGMQGAYQVKSLLPAIGVSYTF